MTRAIAPIALLLLLPAPGWAQGDLNGLVTAVESAPPEAGGAGIDASRLGEYLRAVEAADMALQINARGQTREALGVSSLNVEAKWGNGNGGSPTLTELRVRPGVPDYWNALRALPEGQGNRTVTVEGEALQVSRVRQRDDYVELSTGGRSGVRYYADGKVTRSNGRGYRQVRGPQRLGGRLNEVTFKDGVMKLDISGAPDLTVEKVTWERTSDGRRRMRMHVNFWPDLIVEPDGTVNINAFGGIEVGKMEALTRLNRWPPTIEDLQQAFANGSGAQGLTGQDFDVHYQVTGRARPQPFPFTSMMEAGANFDVRGAVAVRPDGSITTIGDGNRLKVDLRIGEQDFVIGRLPTSTRLSGRTGPSTASLNGTYAINMPTAGSPLNLSVDGQVDYHLQGDRLVLNLPTGTRVGMGHGEVQGTVGLGLQMGGATGTQVTLRDGRYQLTVDGPVQLERLRLDKLTADELDFTGKVQSRGTLSSDPSGELAVQGDVRADLTVAGEPNRDGAVQVLLDQFQGGGRLANGSNAKVEVDQVTVTLDPIAPNGRPTRVRDVRADGVHVDARTTLRDVRGTQGGVDVELGAVRADGDFTFSASRNDGLGGLQGTIDTEVLEGGTLKAEGLPGRPVLPGRSTPTPAEVVTIAQPAPATRDEEVVEAPGFVEHPVASGDTLWALSRRYGVTPAAIKAANGLTSDTIRRGSTLRIPVASAPAQPVGQATRRETTTAGASPVASVPTNTNTVPGPRNGRVTTEIQAGSSARIEIDSARQGEHGLEIDGHVTTLLKLGAADVAVGSVEAKILGQAQASLARTGFSLRSGQPNSLRLGRVQVPVRVDIQRGSHVLVNLPKFPVDVPMDRDGSYATFVAHVAMTAEGMRVERITDADLYLESSAAAVVAGHVAEVNGEKTIRFQGRIELLDNGLDFFGNLTVQIRGDDTTPIVKIRW